MTGTTVLAHGVSSREDLPIPFTYALVGAAVALLVSFLALGLLWRESRLDPEHDGVALPARVQSVLDGRPFRVLLRAVGLLATAYVVLGAVAGKDDALNPTAGVVYVLFWIGLPLTSAILGPVWRLLNPVRTVHGLLSLLLRTRPEEGLAPLPPRVGYWPAAAMLLAFVWLELIAPNNDTLPVLRTFFAGYLAVNLLAATYFGSRWFDRADGFEAYSSLIGRAAPLGRRGDGRLVLRSPLTGLAGVPVAPGLFAVVGVLLGSTAYDSLANSVWWINVVQDSALPPRWTATLGLLGMVTLVTSAFFLASAVAGRGSGLRPVRFAGEFAHTLVPIVLGYVVAHYWSLLVLAGQTTVIRLSDPLGTGANWLGTADRGIDGRLADPGFVAVLQVCAVLLGHVIGVVLAHDRAVRLLPRNRAVAGQVPLLLLMVGYTVGGLSLLFGA
ncbi:MAG: hypothetical protein QOJ49_550 [Actinomycetota bacterium]|nr:hypothetical protein [Actinomycetota bacterium]